MMMPPIIRYRMVQRLAYIQSESELDDGLVLGLYLRVPLRDLSLQVPAALAQLACEWTRPYLVVVVEDLGQRFLQ